MSSNNKPKKSSGFPGFSKPYKSLGFSGFSGFSSGFNPFGEPERTMVNTTIKEEKVKDGIFVSHKSWIITKIYSDKTREINVVPTEPSINARIVHITNKSTKSTNGWPGNKRTFYFSDGRKESQSTVWRCR
jgi:hypothetical protein